MQLREDQVGVQALTAVGVEAVNLSCSLDFGAFTSRFPYALAFDRDPATAVEADFASCFAEVTTAQVLLEPNQARYSVKYFMPNDVPLFAIVECRIPVGFGGSLLLEFIVVGKERKALALEGVSLERLF